ncbi:MAG: hypothetical protein JWM35_467 [Verrucomicrobia bacterium]|nr:hypothetical protein [Verrucomicrobiota bacterium]
MPPQPKKTAILIFIAVFVVGLAWPVYTKHAWEDYYITYRASKNLAMGHGLTFTEGERVHSFTSPLGTLLPALCSVVTGNRSDDDALWIFRIMSLAAYAGAGIFLWKLVRSIHASAGPAWLVLVLFAIDTKIVDFTTNGMETGILLLFLGWTLHASITTPRRQALHLGIAWAGLMWTRPDSFVYIAAISIGAFLFCPPPTPAGGRWGWIKIFLTAGVITSLLYLPWIIWAWSYYGTPVPHTITAKGLFHPPMTPASLLKSAWDFPRAVTTHVDMLATTFMPAYSSITGWPTWMLRIAYWIALGCMTVWLMPGIKRETRLASFALCAGEFYLTSFVYFPVPWYIPTLTVFALIVLSGLVGQLVASHKNWRTFAWAFSGLLVAGSLTITLLSAHEMRLQEAVIERGERQAIGLWLREHASSNRDTVFLECLGYIGFYSNLKMYDFPGMSSPEMVAARKKIGVASYPESWPALIQELSPDWLVLRSNEAETIRQLNPGMLKRDYSLAKTFDVRAQVDAIPFIMGRNYLANDAYFEVYHRSVEKKKPQPFRAAALK